MQLYRIAIEEYRFETKLSWERIKFYLVLNSALLAAATSLVRIESAPSWPLLGVLLVGGCVSWMGQATIRKGHLYYRNTIYKKTLVEDQLGLHEMLPQHPSERATLAIATTDSQAHVQEILQSPEHWLKRRLRPASVTWKLVALMWMFLCLYAVLILRELAALCLELP